MVFLQIYFNGELKFVAPLHERVTRIGRAADNDVVIDNAGVSGYHAIITQDDNAFFVEDMNSTNGVFLSGRRVQREPIRYGDEISIHKHTLKLTAVNLSPETMVTTTAAPIISQNQTMEVDVAQLRAMMQLQQAQAPYLQQISGEQSGHKWMLSKQHFDIGKGSTCDLRVGGWFTPRLIAKISRQSDGYYLLAENRWTSIRINSILVHGRVKLQNRDRILVRGISLIFCQSSTIKPGDR